LFFSPCLIIGQVRHLLAHLYFVRLLVCVHEPGRTHLSLRTLSTPIPRPATMFYVGAEGVSDVTARAVDGLSVYLECLTSLV